MRVLPLTLLVCSVILSAGTMAASPARENAQPSVNVQQAADAPVQKKVPRPRKSKTDGTMAQPADTAPSVVRDKNGRFVKKESPRPESEQKPATVTAPAKGAKLAPTPSVSPKTAEPGATARCQDGTFSHSKQHSGSCSRHGGVAQWLTE